MALTNAERQERYRQRLKDRANSPDEMLRAICLEWLETTQKEWRQEEDHTPEADARIELLRQEVQSQDNLGDHLMYMVDIFMGDRLKRMRAPKPAKARRSKPAARS